MATVPVVSGTRDERATKRRALDLRLAIAPGVAAVLIFASVCAIGLLVTHAFAHSWVVRGDLHAERWFAAHRTSTWNTLTGVGTLAADTIPVIVMLAIAMVAAWRLTRGLLAPLFLAVTVGVEKLIYLTASVVVDRPRPPVHAIGHVYATKSFPSGHVASSITLYGAIAVLLVAYGARLVWRAIASTWVVLAPIVVAFSRMYRGYHYPTDVIVGALLGAVWLAVTTQLVLRRALTEPPASADD